MGTESLLFLTGHVSTIFPPVQVTKKIWHPEVILRMVARNQPAGGLVQIQFTEQHMHLLDGLRLGEHVVVSFPIRGVDWRDINYFAGHLHPDYSLSKPQVWRRPASLNH